MERLLLDTHTFIWKANDSARLSHNVKAVIDDPANEKFVSAASAWEIAIKNALGRQTDLRLPDTPANMATNLGFNQLPVTFAHAEQAATLPMHHHDPFDRLLVAQAQPAASIPRLPEGFLPSRGAVNAAAPAVGVC